MKVKKTSIWKLLIYYCELPDDIPKNMIPMAILLKGAFFIILFPMFVEYWRREEAEDLCDTP